MWQDEKHMGIQEIAASLLAPRSRRRPASKRIIKSYSDLICSDHSLSWNKKQDFVIAGQFCVKVLLKIFPRGQWSGIGIILELYLV